MLTLFLLFIIFFLVLVFSFLYEGNNQGGIWSYIGVALSLVLLAAFRPIGIDCDSETYLQMYNGERLILTENSFILISDFAYYVCHSFRVMFFIYALLGVSIKLYAIRKLTPLFFLSILMYLSYYYILHDFTQIRAGVASAFFLLALYYMSEKKRIIAFLLVLIAVFFHSSSLAYLPLLVLSTSSLSKWQRWTLALAVPLSYLIYFLGIDLIMSIPIPFVGDKLELYQNLQAEGASDIESVNVFNLVFIVKIVIYYILLWKYDIIEENAPIVSLLMKVYVFSIISFIILFSLPVLAFRVSELYGVVEILLFPLLYFAVKPDWISRLIVFFIALVMLCINVFYNDLIRVS